MCRNVTFFCVLERFQFLFFKYQEHTMISISYNWALCRKVNLFCLNFFLYCFCLWIKDIRWYWFWRTKPSCRNVTFFWILNSFLFIFVYKWGLTMILISYNSGPYAEKLIFCSAPVFSAYSFLWSRHVIDLDFLWLSLCRGMVFSFR